MAHSVRCLFKEIVWLSNAYFAYCFVFLQNACLLILEAVKQAYFIICLFFKYLTTIKEIERALNLKKIR